MMLHHVAIEMSLIVVCMQQNAEGISFPTCDTFRKYGPILARVDYDSSTKAMSQSLISLQSGQVVSAGFVTNKSVMFKQVGQSSLLVTKYLPDNKTHMIVNAQTGQVQANEEIMKMIGGFPELWQEYSVVTIHDDLTMITYISEEGKAYSFNMVTGGETVNSTQLHSRSLLRDEHQGSSLAVRDENYCIIGGDRHQERPMVCYNKSNRKWKTSEKIKIRRAFHSSLWHNGVLYVCGGMIGYDLVDWCNLYNTSYDFIRNISIPCAPTKYGRLYVVGGELNYAAQGNQMWSVSKLDTPSNCTNITEVGNNGLGLDSILDPWCPSIELPDEKSAAKRLRLSIVFSGVLLPFWIWHK